MQRDDQSTRSPDLPIPVPFAETRGRHMSASIMETQLFNALCNHGQLAARGYAVRLEPGKGIILLRKGHPHGCWSWHGTHFRFTPADRTAPTYQIGTATEALLYTCNAVLARRATSASRCSVPANESIRQTITRLLKSQRVSSMLILCPSGLLRHPAIPSVPVSVPPAT